MIIRLVCLQIMGLPCYRSAEPSPKLINHDPVVMDSNCVDYHISLQCKQSGGKFHIGVKGGVGKGGNN